MRELTIEETKEVSGGIGPLAIIAIDLALNGVMLAGTALLTSSNFSTPKFSAQ